MLRLLASLRKVAIAGGTVDSLATAPAFSSPVLEAPFSKTERSSPARGWSAFAFCLPSERCRGTAWPLVSAPLHRRFGVCEGLPANVANLSAAFRSESRSGPQGTSGLPQRKVWSGSRRSLSTQPHPGQALLEGSHRSASGTTARRPYVSDDLRFTSRHARVKLK